MVHSEMDPSVTVADTFPVDDCGPGIHNEQRSRAPIIHTARSGLKYLL